MAMRTGGKSAATPQERRGAAGTGIINGELRVAALRAGTAHTWLHR